MAGGRDLSTREKKHVKIGRTKVTDKKNGDTGADGVGGAAGADGGAGADGVDNGLVMGEQDLLRQRRQVLFASYGARARGALHIAEQWINAHVCSICIASLCHDTPHCTCVRDDPACRCNRRARK